MRRIVLWLVCGVSEAAVGQSFTITPGAEVVTATALGRIHSAVQLRDGTLLVADELNRRIAIFDRAGHFRKVIGRSGAGPGEFRAISWFGRCAADTLAVVDLALSRITLVDRQGTVLESRNARSQTRGITRRITSYDRRCSTSGAWATVSWPTGTIPSVPGPHRETSEVWVELPGRQPVMLGSFAGPERMRYASTDGPRQFGKGLVIGVSSSRVYVGTADSFFVQSFDYDGRPQAALSLRRPLKPLRKRDIAVVAEEWRRRLTPDQLARAVAMAERDLPPFAPAYDRFVFDEVDRVWIEEGHRPADEMRTWFRFDSTGQHTGTLTVPSNFEVFQVFANTVMGKWSDGDGAESIRRFGLRSTFRRGSDGRS